MTMFQKIEALMLEKHINKRQLSNKTGVPYPTILSLFHEGRDGANVNTVFKIAQYFGVTLDFLLNDTIEKSPNEIQRLYDLADEKTKRMVDFLLKENQNHRSGNQ